MRVFSGHLRHYGIHSPLSKLHLHVDLQTSGVGVSVTLRSHGTTVPFFWSVGYGIFLKTPTSTCSCYTN